MEMQIRDLSNKEKGKVTLSSDIFGQEFRSDILSRVVNWQQAKARSGTHKTKGRSEVEGSTRKIYKQKGTGQARHGDIKAPVFVGGGIVFGPVVRSHEYKLNKKVKNLALKVALSLKVKENSFIVLDNANCKSPKASDLSKQISAFGAKSLLIIDSAVDENLKLSSRNLKGVDALPFMGMNVIDILKHEKVCVTVDALKQIEERLAC